MSRSPSARARVHAFVGENGAGKSTLGKIIAGVFPQDQGDLVLRGTTVSFGSPRAALVRGIALVAQEVALVPTADRGRERVPRRGAEARRLHRSRVAPRAVRPARRGRGLRPPGRVRRRAPADRRPAAGRDPPGARPRRRPDRPRRAVGQPVDRRGRAPARDRPRAADAGPHGDPRLPLPDRGARPVRRRHRAARRPRRPDERDRRRDRVEPRDRDARSAGRSCLPGEAAAACGRPGRPRHRRSVRAGRRRCLADVAGRRDRRAGRAHRRRPLRARPSDLRREPRRHPAR